VQLEELQPWLHSCWWTIEARGQRYLEAMMNARLRCGLPQELQAERPSLPYCDVVRGNLQKLRRHPRVRLKKTPCRFPSGRDASSGLYAAKAPGVIDAFKKSVEQDLELRWDLLLRGGGQ